MGSQTTVARTEECAKLRGKKTRVGGSPLLSAPTVAMDGAEHTTSAVSIVPDFLSTALNRSLRPFVRDPFAVHMLLLYSVLPSIIPGAYLRFCHLSAC